MMVWVIYDLYVMNYMVKCSNIILGWSKEVYNYNFILIKLVNVNNFIERYNRFFLILLLI